MALLLVPWPGHLPEPSVPARSRNRGALDSVPTWTLLSTGPREHGRGASLIPHPGGAGHSQVQLSCTRAGACKWVRSVVGTVRGAGTASGGTRRSPQWMSFPGAVLPVQWGQAAKTLQSRWPLWPVAPALDSHAARKCSPSCPSQLSLLAVGVQGHGSGGREQQLPALAQPHFQEWGFLTKRWPVNWII